MGFKVNELDDLLYKSKEHDILIFFRSKYIVNLKKNENVVIQTFLNTF